GVLSTGTAVAIATETGAVNLSAHGKTIEVRAGTQSIAVAGKPPSGAEPIAARLLLKVADAAAAQEREGLCAEVEGTSPSGAEVLVDGAPAAVAEDGRFRVRVPAAPDKASVGTIEGLHRARDGIWEAQYVPPDDAIPQVAILTAAAGGEVAWLAIPLWAEGDAVVKTRPRGRISVDIGSQTFGPVVADAHGNAVVPVVVPPGVYEAHQGKRVIPLHVPPSRTI